VHCRRKSHTSTLLLEITVMMLLLMFFSGSHLKKKMVKNWSCKKYCRSTAKNYDGNILGFTDLI